MTLRGLIKRLGLAEVASRAGVTSRTVRRWLAEGVTSSGRQSVRSVAARRERSLKAAETRRENQRKAERAAARRARDEFQERAAEAAEVEKPLAPRKGPSVRRTRDYLEPGYRELDTFRYTGSIVTYTIGKILDQIAFGAIVEMVLSAWHVAKSSFVRATFLFFRFVSPRQITNYRGRAIPRDGRWVDWWASTKVQASDAGIASNIETVLSDARDETAGNQVVWLEQVQVNMYDFKEDIEDIARLRTRQLRGYE